MPDFSLLSAEIRYTILEHVIVSATTPVDPPDINLTQPKDWRPCLVYKLYDRLRDEAPTHLQRTDCPTSRLIPYLLVNKSFHRDVQHVWTRYVAPNLFPVLSMTLVGADRDRALKGTLVSWLSPLPTAPNITRIEWRFRFYDQQPNSTGHSSLKRSYEYNGMTYDLTLVNVFEKAFLRDWYILRPHFPPVASSGAFGYWVLRLSTEVDPGVHLASSEYFEVKNSQLKVMPHPYRETLDLKDHVQGYLEFDLLTGAEIWVDDTLVHRLTPQRKAEFEGMEFGTEPRNLSSAGRCDVICEDFEYVMPIDPLLPPKPPPEHAAAYQTYTDDFTMGGQA